MHWITGLPQVAAGSFVSDLWQGSILAVGVWLCLRLLPQVTAAIRFAIWTAVFAVLALRPFLQAYLIHAPQSSQVHAAWLRIDVRWSFAIAGVWVLLSLVRVVKLTVSGFELHGIWKRAVPVGAEGSAVLPFVAGWRRAQLCTSRDVDRPSVIGFFSPRVLIPEEMMERLTAAEMEQIVLHEMGHLRRGDDWVNLLQKVGLVLFPLNPVLMWIERRLCFERELACDEDVLRQTRAPKAYAQCLTSLAERRLDRRAASLSLGAWERESELARRVHSILRLGKGMGRTMGRTEARVALGVVVLALMGGATELSRCPRIVSFADATPTFQKIATTLPVGAYQPVVARSIVQAHETLLKASMPASYVPAVSRPMAERRRPRHMHTPLLQRASQQRRPMQKRALIQQWVVLTSFGQPVAVSRMLLAVPGGRGFVSSYAAVPTDAGWLVIQL